LWTAVTGQSHATALFWQFLRAERLVAFLLAICGSLDNFSKRNYQRNWFFKDFSMPNSEQFPQEVPVVVIGGGPAGATVSTLVAQKGHCVVLLERDHFPRFHIGESLIPETYWVL
jgi:hypothetical protein